MDTLIERLPVDSARRPVHSHEENGMVEEAKQHSQVSDRTTTYLGMFLIALRCCWGRVWIEHPSLFNRRQFDWKDQ
jgi:hypothetical protein